MLRTVANCSFYPCSRDDGLGGSERCWSDFAAFLRKQGKAKNTVKAYCLAVCGYMRWYEDIYGEPMGQLCRANVLEHISFLLQYKLVGTLGSQPGVSSVSHQSYNKRSNWLTTPCIIE